MTDETEGTPTGVPSIPQHDALRLQLAMIAGNEPRSSCFEVRALRNASVVARKFVRVYGIRRTTLEIERLTAHADVFIGCAARISYTSGTLKDIERVWCLWVDCDTAEASAMLRRFRPRPSLVTASGGVDRLHGYWALNCPLSVEGADRANRRLRNAVGGDDVCDATRVLRPIGSLNHKHGRTVECVRLEPITFHPAEVVGGLEDDERYAPRRSHSEKPSQRRSGSSTDGLVQTVADAEEGKRNHLLYWAACRAAEEGTLDKVRDQLEDAALDAGLEPDNVKSTLRSAERRAA